MPYKVFVTGGYGFVGRHLVNELLEAGHEVTILSRDRHNPKVPLECRKGTLHEVSWDLSNPASLERILAEYGIDTVFHLAAQTQMSTAILDPYGTFEANIKGTWDLLEACRRQKTPRVVVASTDKVYGRSPAPYKEDTPLLPDRPYETSKACVDLLARTYAATYSMSVAVVRCVNIFGPGHMNFSTLVPGTIRRIHQRTRPMVRNGGSMKRDWLYVRDAVQGYMSLLGNAGREFIGPVNFGSGRPTSVMEIVNLISQFMEWNGGVTDELDVHGEIVDQWSDCSLARVLGWHQNYSLQQGLAETIKWYMNLWGDESLQSMARKGNQL